MMIALRSLVAGRLKTTGALHLALGERGEQMALDYLKEYEGYQIVARNFRVPLGRGFRGQKLTAEIDIIAYDAGVLTFVEVKTRTSNDMVAPERAVDLRKQRQIAKAARRYRQLIKVYEEPYRYDVVTVLAGATGAEIAVLRGYFDDRVFQRSRYFNYFNA